MKFVMLKTFFRGAIFFELSLEGTLSYIVPEANNWLHHANQLTGGTLSLPNGTAVSGEDVRAICRIIRLAVMNGNELASC